MSNEWKGRVIRGGIVVVCTMGLIGAMGGLTGIAVGYPGVVRASVIILAVAAWNRYCIRHRRQHPQPVADGQTTMPPGTSTVPTSNRQLLAPGNRSNQVQGRQETQALPVVHGCDSAPLLQFVEGSFYQVSLLIQPPVVFPRVLPV